MLLVVRWSSFDLLEHQKCWVVQGLPVTLLKVSSRSLNKRRRKKEKFPLPWWHSILHCLWRKPHGYLVSGQTRSIDVVKLFCCLFAMMDEGLSSVFFFSVCPFFFFLSHSGHISLLYSQRSGCFCGITSLAVSQHCGPVCPAPLSTVMHTFKKKTKNNHLAVPWQSCAVTMCFSGTNSLQDVPEPSRGF